MLKGLRLLYIKIQSECLSYSPLYGFGRKTPSAGMTMPFNKEATEGLTLGRKMKTLLSLDKNSTCKGISTPP